MGDLLTLSACQMAQKIRDRRVSAVELLECHLAHIERHNPVLNAVCTLDGDRARLQARQADEAIAQGQIWGPLHGVPITIKDTFETAGLRTCCGHPPFKSYVPDQDATAVSRLRDAGAILMGKTNLPELAGDYQSANPVFSRTNNPWNLDCTPGGTSGGSAAAVAAGFSPLDLASDFAGSIRQPAHFCGIYGLKPTEHRVSTAGIIPELPGMPHCFRQMMTVGAVARSPADLQLCLSLIAGSDARRPDIPPVPLDTPTQKSLSQLKIAWLDAWTDVPVAEVIRTSMGNARQKLVDAGGMVAPWPANFDFATFWQLYGPMGAYLNNYVEPRTGSAIRRGLTTLFRSATQGDHTLRPLGNFAQFWSDIFTPSLKGYFEVLTARDRLIAHVDEALAAWDVLILPVAATVAFPHCPSWGAIAVDGTDYPYAVANGAYTMPFNLTGHPAVTMPIGFTPQGLPIGIQLVGKRWRDLQLLSIAQTLDPIIGNLQHPPQLAHL